MTQFKKNLEAILKTLSNTKKKNVLFIYFNIRN